MFNLHNYPDFSFASYKVALVDRKTASSFICKHHYSQSCPNVVLYYGLFLNGDIVGCAAFGHPAMRHQSSCYNVDIELRRLCLLDKAPKNSESFFIGKTLKDLKRKGYKKVLSLADPEHFHTGVIYRASNFRYEGVEKGGGSRLIVIDGKEVHSRTAYSLYGTSGIQSLKKLLGEHRVTGRNKLRKHVYTYELLR